MYFLSINIKEEGETMNKSILFIISFMLMILVVCSIGFTEEKVILTVWEWDMNERPEAVQAIIQTFEAKNPNIKINLETTDYNSMEQKSILAGEANVMPDCLEIGGQWTQTLAKHGYLLELDPFIQKEEGFIEDFFRVTKDPWTEKYHYLPWRMTVFGLYGVENYMDEAGYTVAPWTWEEFEDLCKKSTVDTDGDGQIDRYGFVDYTVGICRLPLTMIHAFGADFEDKDGKLALNTPKAIQAIEYATNIWKKYGPPGLAMFGPKEGRDVFLSGKAAMIAEGSYMSSILEIGMAPGLKWKPILNPIAIQNPKRFARVAAEAYGIGKDTKHPEEAWEFLKFIAGPEGDAILIKLAGNPPGHISNLSLPEIKEQPLVKVFADQIAMAKENVYEDYVGKTILAYTKYMPEAYQSIFYEKQTVQEAMDELVRKVNEETYGK
jgi:multiple sugar transport system substrate-binding protein